MAASGIRCRLNFPLHLPPWPVTAEVRHNLFLAFKEILHNAIKYSKASEVKITLEHQTDAFALIIEDNGSGFALNSTAGQSNGRDNGPARGHGLKHIQQRLQEIGGTCQIVSEAGAGTRIRLLVRVQSMSE